MEDTIKVQNSDSEFSAMLYGRIEVAMLELFQHIKPARSSNDIT